MPDTRVHSIDAEAANVAVAAELTAVIVAITDGQPRVPMTIVTSRHRKRSPKPAQAVEIKVPRIAQHTPLGRP